MWHMCPTHTDDVMHCVCIRIQALRLATVMEVRHRRICDDFAWLSYLFPGSFDAVLWQWKIANFLKNHCWKLSLPLQIYSCDYRVVIFHSDINFVIRITFFEQVLLEIPSAIYTYIWQIWFYNRHWFLLPLSFVFNKYAARNAKGVPQPEVHDAIVLALRYNAFSPLQQCRIELFALADSHSFRVGTALFFEKCIVLSLQRPYRVVPYRLAWTLGWKLSRIL